MKQSRGRTHPEPPGKTPDSPLYPTTTITAEPLFRDLLPVGNEREWPQAAALVWRRLLVLVALLVHIASERKKVSKMQKRQLSGMLRLSPLLALLLCAFYGVAFGAEPPVTLSLEFTADLNAGGSLPPGYAVLQCSGAGSALYFLVRPAAAATQPANWIVVSDLKGQVQRMVEVPQPGTHAFRATPNGQITAVVHSRDGARILNFDRFGNPGYVQTLELAILRPGIKALTPVENGLMALRPDGRIDMLSAESGKFQVQRSIPNAIEANYPLRCSRCPFTKMVGFVQIKPLPDGRLAMLDQAAARLYFVDLKKGEVHSRLVRTQHIQRSIAEYASIREDALRRFGPDTKVGVGLAAGRMTVTVDGRLLVLVTPIDPKTGVVIEELHLDGSPCRTIRCLVDGLFAERFTPCDLVFADGRLYLVSHRGLLAAYRF